ncbi:precorrin-3B C(17)-methyltransferase [Natranaerobius trueperi]|uniref:precorrin-3B C(17)-methyltransferase n=1 Tax=Natranaerobius trueperi TaxID=759412 RepID=UPI00146A152B|nr:precorrin-3B C(17)-methyltransferase [Natranaerobius trueperi]
MAAVGIGPGGGKSLSLEAYETIKEATVVIGYKTYLNLISELTEGKEIYFSSMKQEVERCKEALKLANQNKKVAIVSSGDPGVYGMAGVLLELRENLDLEVRIIPGITSATGTAASLGAPLMHDFAVISLSDLLTPWEKIERRIEGAASSDFVIVLYNPKSSNRVKHIEKAQTIISKYRSHDTPVGIVTNNYRNEEKITISTLGKFVDEEIDMRTTVIIGNSKSYVKFSQIITPRGYTL